MKNQRIKINIDRKPIERQKVDDNKNFGAVMAGFTAVTLPFYKKWWFWGATGTAVVAAAIIGASAFNYKADSQPSESTEEKVIESTPVAQNAHAAYEPFIKPAFKGFNVDFTSFIVTSGHQKLLKMPGGTTIRIPACHFLYADGSEVHGKVEIRFREMTNPVDFAVSGIPMTYDSAGQKYLFESAGMCEIQGFKDGEPVLVNPVCPIKIEQQAIVTDAHFNMYYLDTVARNWQYIGQPNWIMDANQNKAVPDIEMINSDNLVSSTEVIRIVGSDTVFHSYTEEMNSPALDAELKALEKLKRNAPKPPKQYNSAKYNFNIVANSNDYPDLQPFASTVFEVDSLDKNFTPAIYHYNWNKAAIEETDCACGKQNLLLSRGLIYEPETSVAKDTAGLKEDKQRKTSVKSLSWWDRFWNNVRSLFGMRKKEPVIRKLRGRKTNIGNNKFQSGDTLAIASADIFGVKLVPTNLADINPVKKSLRNSNFVTIQVYPILTGKDYDKAYAEYLEKLAEHNKLIAEKTARIAQLRKEAEEQRKAQLEQWQKQQALMASYNSQNLSYGGIRNAFSAEKFGIYNSDNPVKLSKTTTVTLNFADKNGDEQFVDKAYLIIKNRNALMANYYSNCCNNLLTYSTADNNQLFVVLPDDYVGVVEQADFNRFIINKNYTVRLRISPTPMKNTEELKVFLGVLPPTETASANHTKKEVFDR